MMTRKAMRKTADGAAPRPESEFSYTLARVAVAQICQSMGFKGAENSAIQALTDIATRHLKEIAKLATASANSSGRTQSNLLDVIVAVEDLASIQGFPGSSNIRSHSLCSSVVIKDLMKFVKYTDEIPFAQPLPPRRIFFQGVKGKGKILKDRDDGDSSSSSSFYSNGGSLRHVPRWLPALPVVEAAKEERKREVELKWGCLDDGRKEENGGVCGEVKMVERESSNEIEISGKRRKVRMRMGLGNQGMNGKLRSVGIRKRVWCE